MNVIRFAFCFYIISLVPNWTFAQKSENEFVQLSKDFLYALQEKKETHKFIEKIASISINELESKLKSQNEKLTFWINIYNGFIQHHLNQNPAYYDDKRKFFKQDLIHFRDKSLSFANIEHGIIRRSQLELFLGYITNPFAPKYEKKLRIDHRDYRIHFALNCGAKSCPPVAIYSSENLDQELDFIAEKFLKKFSQINVEENLITTTALFSWFRGDFGGGEGIRNILVKYGIAPTKEIRVKTNPYDWSLLLDNYVDIQL